MDYYFISTNTINFVPLFSYFIDIITSLLCLLPFFSLSITVTKKISYFTFSAVYNLLASEYHPFLFHLHKNLWSLIPSKIFIGDCANPPKGQFCISFQCTHMYLRGFPPFGFISDHLRFVLVPKDAFLSWQTKITRSFHFLLLCYIHCGLNFIFIFYNWHFSWV